MQNIKLAILSISLVLLLIACATGDRPAFRSMSDEELYAYNLDKPEMQHVFCIQRLHTSSRIKRRECRTVADWVYRYEQTIDSLVTMQPAGAGIPRAR